VAQNDDSGDKTEAPTQKRLRDARKKGDVSKSKELTSTVTLIAWLGLAIGALPLVGMRLTTLLDRVFEAIPMAFSHSAPAIGWLAFETLVWLSALIFGPVAAIALITEFLQIGPVLSFEKIKPKLENMDPVKRIGEWFSADQLMELAKSVVKACVMIVIAWLVLRSQLPQIALLPTGTLHNVSQAYFSVGLRLLAWTAAAFSFVSVLDVFWSRHRYIKKQRMSIRDIREEHKENEGDPIVKSVRQRLHRELAEGQAKKITASATALVVNPTHIAVALLYDLKVCPVPVITMVGTDDVAMDMRKAAQDANVPVVRNVPLARALLAEACEGDTVPERHFALVAEVILWAKQAREDIDIARGRKPFVAESARPQRRAPPGEDLTHYPSAQTAFEQQPDPS